MNKWNKKNSFKSIIFDDLNPKETASSLRRITQKYVSMVTRTNRVVWRFAFVSLNKSPISRQVFPAIFSPLAVVPFFLRIDNKALMNQFNKNRQTKLRWAWILQIPSFRFAKALTTRPLSILITSRRIALARSSGSAVVTRKCTNTCYSESASRRRVLLLHVLEAMHRTLSS